MKKRIKIIIFFIVILLIVFLFKNYFWNDLVNSFNRTIIDEDRYLLFLQGFKATIVISLLSIIFGTIIGFIIFLLNRNKIFKNFAYFYVKFFQGVPITVILLIFYFVIFGKININPVLVAVISFSIYFSAYISEIFKGAYASLNRIQIDSAYSLGFTKIQTLKYIIIPQVLVYIIPVYKNEVVSLIKLTSICGYISIMDLTKASDIIRNRTYEPFFPLIFTALVYLVICNIISRLLDAIYFKINPRGVKKYAK